jgi:hypothetical protein
LPELLEEPDWIFAFQTSLEFTLNFTRLREGQSNKAGDPSNRYLAGICAAPEAGAAGTTGTSRGIGATAAGPSSTLPELAGRRLPK